LKVNWKSKKFWIQILIVFVVFFLITSLSGNASEKEQLLAEKDKELSSLQAKYDDLNGKLREKEGKIKDLEAKVEEAEPWFELSEAERQRKIDEEKVKKEAEEAAAKKKAEEEEAKAKKKEAEEAARKEAEEKEAKRKAEEEAKKGYETGITYDQLARTPDDYIGKKVKFHGKVIQVMEGDGTTQIRFAVNEDYDTIIYGEFDSSIVDSRILEDDVITIMGISSGLLTYESTMGASISIPGIMIDKIEQ